MNRSTKVVSLVDLVQFLLFPIGLQTTRTCTVSVLLDVLLNGRVGAMQRMSEHGWDQKVHGII
jgi:hypothetical protein